MSSVSPFTVSVDIILLVFNNIYFLKMNSSDYWKCTWFTLELFTFPPVHYCVGIYLFFPPPHWAHLCQSNSKCFLFLPIISMWNFILGWYFFASLYSASTAISTPSGYIFFKRESLIYTLILPPLKPLWSSRSQGNYANSSSSFWYLSITIDLQSCDYQCLVT